MEVQYKAEFDCKLVNSSYGVKMFINGVLIGLLTGEATIIND